eukprot:gene21730-23268_t
MANKPLCVYHGDDNRSYSWGASVQYAKEDGHYYMWVAAMTNHCTIGQWRTNSEVQLARSTYGPLGPFEKLADLILPWAHNPQTIVSPDSASKHGYVYAVYTLGNGVQLSGPPKQCNSTGARTGRARGDMKANSGQSDEKVKGAPLIGDFGQGQGQGQGPSKKRITANFTIHWAEEAAGPYQQHNASILNWPAF